MEIFTLKNKQKHRSFPERQIEKIIDKSAEFAYIYNKLNIYKNDCLKDIEGNKTQERSFREPMAGANRCKGLRV
jgi:hypothetical protein